MTANLLPRGRRRIGFVTALSALVGAALPASAAEDRKPPFEFVSPTSLELGWTADDRGAKAATVVSNMTSPLTLGVTLSPLELKDPSGKALDNTSVLRLSADGKPVPLDGSGTFVLPAAGSVTLRVSPTEAPLNVAPAAPTSGTSAFLTLSEPRTTRFVVRLPVKWTTASASPPCPTDAALKPLVDNLTMTVHRWPFTTSDRCSDCRLPVAAGASGDAGKDKPFVAGLSDDKGGTVRVHASGVTSDPAPSLDLKADPAPHPGTYKGKIDVDPGNASAGSVSLILIVKHEWPAPVLVLALSVYGALRIKRYLTVWRGIWTLREREAALGALFKTSQAAFDQAARGRTYASMSLHDDVSVRRQALVKRLDDLEKSGDAVTAETAGYKAAVAELETIESTLRLWASFANRLEALDDAVVAARRTADLVPPELRGHTTHGLTPRVIVGAAATLAPQALECAELGAFGDRVDKARAFVTAWTRQASSVGGLHEIWKELAKSKHKMSPENQVKLDAGIESLASVVSGLWFVELHDDNAWSALLAVVKELRERLDMLAVSIQAKAALDYEAPMPKRAARRVALDAPAPPEPELTDEERRARYGAALRNWENRVGWIAFAIALIAGMNQYYLGQAFGTFKDYLSLVLVGFGTRAALDALNAVLDRLFLPR